MAYPRRLDKAGEEFIADHEGEVLYLYDDPAGYATFGIGHLVAKKRVAQLSETTRRKYGTKARPLPRDKARALSRALFRRDVAKHEAAVLQHVPARWRMSQDRFNAFTSLSFNLGTGVLTPEPPLTSLGVALRGEGERARERIAAAFLLYVYAGGRKLPGLVRRRSDERALFLRSWK